MLVGVGFSLDLEGFQSFWRSIGVPVSDRSEKACAGLRIFSVMAPSGDALSPEDSQVRPATRKVPPMSPPYAYLPCLVGWPVLS